MLFFFHVRNGSAYTDTLGEDFPDRAAAWRQGTQYAGEVLRDLDGSFELDSEWHLDVRNEAGQLVYRIKVISESTE